MLPVAFLVPLAFPFPRATPLFPIALPVSLSFTVTLTVTIPLPFSFTFPFTISVPIAFALPFPFARGRPLEATFLHLDAVLVDELFLLAEELLVADRAVVDVGQELLAAERVTHQLISGCFNASLEIRIDQHLPGEHRCSGYHGNSGNCPQRGIVETKQWRRVWL